MLLLNLWYSIEVCVIRALNIARKKYGGFYEKNRVIDGGSRIGLFRVFAPTIPTTAESVASDGVEAKEFL